MDRFEINSLWTISLCNPSVLFVLFLILLGGYLVTLQQVLYKGWCCLSMGKYKSDIFLLVTYLIERPGKKLRIGWHHYSDPYNGTIKYFNLYPLNKDYRYTVLQVFTYGIIKMQLVVYGMRNSLNSFTAGFYNILWWFTLSVI